MTGLIVSHNEGHLLAARLRELAFCDELLVVDLASTDDTVAVAEAGGARVIRHPPTPIVEAVHTDVVHHARNDLLVLLDPDEEVPPALAAELAALPTSLAADVGVVLVPWIYYFRGRPLRGTIWGGTGMKGLVARRSANQFAPAVHHGLRLLPGYGLARIEPDGDNAIRHYWLSGYREFIAKHLRYLRFEGPARAGTGEITGLRALVRTPYRAFKESYVDRQGRLDGFDGFALSVLYAAYRTASDVALFRELRRQKPKV